MNPIYRFFLGYSGNLAAQEWPDEQPGMAINNRGELFESDSRNTSGKVTLPQGTDMLMRTNKGIDATIAAYGKGDVCLGMTYFTPTYTPPAGTEYIRYCATAKTYEAMDFLAGRYTLPVYKDDLAVEYAQESGEQFFRAKLSGNLTFLGMDYAAIDGAPFDTRFILDITGSTDGGKTWQEVFKGQFYKTDCEFDIDDAAVVVEPEVRDEYTDVLAGLENEYNLIKLSPQVLKLMYQKRPIIQVYVAEANIVSNFLGNTNWEQDATAITKADMETYHFGGGVVFFGVVDFTEAYKPEGVNDVYAGAGAPTDLGEWSYTINGNDGSYVKFQCIQSLTGIFQISIKIISPDGTELGGGRSDMMTTPMAASVGFKGTWSDGNAFEVSLQFIWVYARIICDVSPLSDGQTTYPIPSPDITADNKNYHYSAPIAYGGLDIRISTNFTDEATPWGTAPNGKYYSPPSSAVNYLPVAQSTWGNYSIWYNNFGDGDFIESKARKPYILNDSFLVADSIAVLLKQFAPGITHKASAGYSEYFYGENTGYGREVQLLLTQKTNVTRGEYTQAAQNSSITLRQLLDMFKNVFRAYWFIEDGKLRIEGIDYFRNGGSYNSTPEIGTDLTQMRNTRNGKPWSLGTSKYKFEKVDMPERYEFGWMDEVTEPFKGLPLEVLSPYVSKGKKEEINVSNFTSDIDYMLLNPGEISNDGFALFYAVAGEAIDTGIGAVEVSAKNGISSKTIPVDGTFQGVQAVADISLLVGGSASLVFLDGNGNPLSPEYHIGAGGASYKVDCRIPQGTASVTIRARGEVTASFYGLLAYGLPQLPFVKVTMDGVEYLLQNGNLAFASLQEAYWRRDMPAPKLKINGRETEALSIEKKKTQEVTYPAPGMTCDPSKLVRTAIGDGQVKETSITLSSLTAKTTLKYDTE